MRGLTKEDCQGQYLSMVNDAEFLYFVEGIGYYPLNPNNLERYVESNNNSSNLLVGIFENGTNTHVGNIHLSQIKPYHNNCMLGIIMQRDYTGKGYALEATNLMVTHAFKVMNLHRIQINVVAENTNAIKLYERIGAEREGLLKEAFYFDNKYQDVIVYGLLKARYFKRKVRGK